MTGGRGRPGAADAAVDDLVRRKGEHISKAIELGDSAGGRAGWHDIQLVHDALPDVDFDSIDLGVEFLGRRVALPLLISGMTGGHDDSLTVNQALAAAAAVTGAMIGVGSQRAALRDPARADSYAVVRAEAPDAFVLANIGISQLLRQPDGQAQHRRRAARGGDGAGKCPGGAPELSGGTDPARGHTWAAGAGVGVIVQLLLEKGSDIAAKSDNGWTALHLAAANGSGAVVQLLLEKGSDIAAKENNGRTALHEAAADGHEAEGAAAAREGL